MAVLRRQVFISFLLLGFAARARGLNWTECEGFVFKILSDITNSTGHDGINRSNIGQYIVSDRERVTGLKSTATLFTINGTSTPSNSEYFALNRTGCEILCRNRVESESPIAWYTPPTSIALTSSWIFPLNILLSLPYESLHEGKIHKTIIAVLNWLGSPQTALTATVFNFRQFRQAHRRVFRHINTHRYHLRCAAYFVLCSLNQFDIDPFTLTGRDSQPSRMLDVLTYGLFRPLSNGNAPDVELTNQLLVQLAFQLRMLRRRGVIPMLANLAMFLAAFVFSVFLAFTELEGDTTTPFSLAFGLLLTWLPLLVVFTIVDRNPISSERTSELISRWLHNVEAVKDWSARVNAIAPGDESEDAEGARPPDDPKIQWWDTTTEISEELQVQGFIGQGRQIQYCGLPHAVLAATETADFTTASPERLEVYATEIAERLQGGKPAAWYVVAGLSFLLVWNAIMSAFVVSFMV
jgi:hypothetical protein